MRRVVALVVAVLSLVAGAVPAAAANPPPVELVAFAAPGDLEVDGFGAITLMGFWAPMVVMSLDGGTPVSATVDSDPVSNADGSKTWLFDAWLPAHAGPHAVEISHTDTAGVTTAVDLDVDVPVVPMPAASVRVQDSPA